jgi:hypothetical protein
VSAIIAEHEAESVVRYHVVVMFYGDPVNGLLPVSLTRSIHGGCLDIEHEQ